jgi:hypothetical protein
MTERSPSRLLPARGVLARGAFAGALLALAAALPCLAASDGAGNAAAAGDRPMYSTRASVDWKGRVLTVEVELDLAAAGLRLPEGRLTAERMVEHDIPALAKDAVFSLQADSHRRVEDAVADGTIGPEALIALGGLFRVESSSLSKDMRRFISTYSLRLDAVASLFLTGASPSSIRAPLETLPTRDYTGIVIYAKGSLPVHGEDVEGEARPCLFPRVYDSDMDLVLDRSLVLPEVLSGAADGGVLGYASAVGVEAGERVGSDPMRIMAIGLFGDQRTDYIVSREDALRILSSAGNRELLRRGKVVVVY